MFDQGAIKLNGDPVEGYDVAAASLDGAVLQAGKRQFVRVRTHQAN